MVKILKPGFYSTIQDMGRIGFQEYGIPISGAMDRYSALMANVLLNNHENDAVIEMTLTGMTLQFEQATAICISGADMSPKLNDMEVKNHKLLPVETGDILSFGRSTLGIRTYLAVIGGFQSENIFGSRSMFPQITKQIKILKNDELQLGNYSKTITDAHTILIQKVSHFTSSILLVHKGPEFGLLSAEQQNHLTTNAFTISKYNNRMAYQLQEPFQNSLSPIITSLVMPGTVQLTPSGQLIILMRDCQTTGGYPRVLQLKESSINSLAQKYVDQKVQFEIQE